MHIGLVGLGKMGNNMRARLRKAGLEVTGYDPNPDVTDVPDLADTRRGAPGAAHRLGHGSVRTDHRRASSPISRRCSSKGDLVIDGGNSRFTDDAMHAALLAEKGIRFVDCGVSGGIWGLKNGYGLMAGGDKRRHHARDADLRRAAP